MNYQERQAMKKRTFNPYKEIGVEEKVRLVIYDNSSKSFIMKKIIAKLDKIEVIFDEKINISGLKYKYQVFTEENKWIDIKKYSYITKADIKKLLKDFKFSDSNVKDIPYLERLNEHQTTYFFQRLLRVYYYFLLSSPSLPKIKRVKLYLNALPITLIQSSNTIAHCYTQITLMTDYAERIVRTESTLISKQSDDKWIVEVIEKYKFDQENLIGFKTGVLVTKGHIASLYDRNEAFDCYQQVLQIGKSFINGFLEIDALSTYYPNIIGINKSYKILDNYSEKGSDLINSEHLVNICFSSDVSYFQMFATSWAHASFYLKNLTLNFGIVTNDKNEYEHCIYNYQAIIKTIANLLKTEVPNNYKFFWIKSTVINRTVYACARFYLAKHLINTYSNNIFISDIDQLVVGDFESYLEVFRNGKYSVYQPITSGLFSMLSGRSHLAGNIYICNDEKGRLYCELLTDYVGMGLEENYSWILDQNATRYASEHIEVGNLDDYGQRALKQFPDLKRNLKQLPDLNSNK
ncbi:hypothetical protein [Psychrobacter sp. GW64-MNA-CIBAN-0177]|uniref:hypothetical protein n=2 Tax=unclassified Psychrobacter TaxID=196806 RepID=UPI00331D4945